MKKLLVLFCCLPLFAATQNYYGSIRFGLSGYQGDLKANALSFKQSKMLVSLGARYDFSDHITGRTYFTLSSLAADDKFGTATMQARNLSFRSKLFDWELTGQYNIFSFNDKWWTPYVFAGVGIYHYKPYTEDVNGNKVYLQPLSTEGQGFAPNVKKYGLTQFSIPFGFGAEYSLNEDMRVGLEFGFRKLFNDYLDDVSGVYVDQAALFAARGQTAVDLAWRADEKSGAPYPAAGTTRGNNKLNDGYYYIALTYTVRLVFDQYKEIAGLPGSKRDKRSGCPATRYSRY